MPPTSRPPIALGWPVRLNGPAPGLADLAGGEVQVDQRRVLRGAARGLVESLAVERKRRRATSRTCAPPRRSPPRECRRSAARRSPVARSLERGRNSRCAPRCRRRSHQPSRSITCSMALKSATSVPGLICEMQVGGARGLGARADRRRSRGVRRRASSMRRKRTGCAKAVFEPAMKMHSACVDVLVARTAARRRRASACSPPPPRTCTGASWCRRCWCRSAPSRAC